MQGLLRFVTTMGLPEDRDAARKLDREKGVRLHPLAAWRIGIVAFAALLAIVAVVLGKSPEFIGAILAAGALLVTYVEWMLSRRESSMDKFYERLETANEHRCNIAESGMKMPETHRYVFTELDNLEYVIERYRFGYMSPGLALRGVNTFHSRFQIAGFTDQLGQIMERDCAYNGHTRAVVNKLIDAEKARKDAATCSGTQTA